MGQDIISDVLNQIMNAKRARKTNLISKKYSKLLLNILDIMKSNGYIDYSVEDNTLKITLNELNECKAIKPRYSVNKKNIDGYIRRFLPSRNFGYILVSTNKGVMTHNDAKENKIGGSLIAYFY